MKHFALLVLLTIGYTASSQTIPQKNSIRVGISKVGLDAPDAVANRYELHYSRLLGFPRLKFEAKLGSLNTSYYESIHPDFLNTRRRTTLDLVINYNVLKGYRHSIYPGIGISIWHRKDLLLNQVQYGASANGTLYVTSFTTRGFDEVNFGAYLSLQYEYRILPDVSISLQAGMNSLGRAGQNSNIGLSVGYLFRR